jgi:hypothetical protein
MKPKVSVGHEDYEFEVLKQQLQFFGPISPKYYVDQVQGRKDLEQTILRLLEVIPVEQGSLFKRITEKGISKKVSIFLQKIMIWDWRDRPTAKQLLEDKWFKE